MEYRVFGSTGMQVSAIGLGCNPFGNEVDESAAATIVGRALDLGVTYFDTSDIYYEGRSERFLGSALRGRRHEAIIATKASGAVGPGPNDRGASRKHLFDALHASLRRLDTDYIDVYQIHQPDRRTPAEETLTALDDMVRAGLVRYIGCSNYASWEVAECRGVARAHGLTPFASCQDQYSLLYREVEATTQPLCVRYGMALIPYFPLAGALLTGAYRQGVAPPAGSRGAIRPTFARWDTERNWRLVEELRAFAAARGYAMPQMAIAWLLSRPQVGAVIAGADTVAHIESNAAATELRLTGDDLAELERITAADR